MALKNVSFCSGNLNGLLVLCLGLISIGCGPTEKAPDASSQAMISGKVTLDGSKPVPLDSNVIFYCSEKNATVSGKVDAIGNYSVKATEKKIGIPVGRYQIMVRPAEPEAANVKSDDYKKMMAATKAAKPEAPKSDIPSRFHTFQTSKIILEIKPGNNPIDLDLSKL